LSRSIGSTLIRQKLSISDKLKAVGASKHWLLLPVKLCMTELNACKNMSLGSTFRCMCNYSFGFELYVNMIVFVAWFDLSIFGCMHSLKQTYNSVLKTDSGVARGKWRHLSPGAAFSGR